MSDGGERWKLTKISIVEKERKNERLMITIKERCVDHRDPSAIEHLGRSGSYPIASPWCSLFSCLLPMEEKLRFRDFGIQFKLHGLDTHGKSPSRLYRI